MKVCQGYCTRLEKVPMNKLCPNKKYCRQCVYNISTIDIQCPCCKQTYRVRRNKKSKPTGGKIGRPRLDEKR